MHTCTHTHTHRGTRTNKHSDYTKLNVHSLKQAANARETWNGWMKMHGTENMAGDVAKPSLSNC